jgi:MFS family permease
MKVAPKKINNKNTSVLTELKEGFNYAINSAPIKYIILLLGLVSLMGMPYTILIPVFAKEILHGGPHTFGFLMGASGLGALMGALYLASRKSILGIGKIIPLSAGLFGLGLISFSFSRFILLSLALMIITGLGMMMQMASSNTLLQTIADDDKRGRVMSFYTMAFMGTAPFGSILAGGLANIIGAPNTILIGGISCILGALIFARKLPELRKTIRPIYVRLGFISPEVSSGIQSATELTVPPEE